MSLDIWLKYKQSVAGGEPEEMHLGSWNITHNVSPMWDLAGCRGALYHSEGLTAAEIVPPLASAIAKMKADPKAYEALNPPNKWGDYNGALRFLEDLHAACVRYPLAVIGVSA